MFVYTCSCLHVFIYIYEFKYIHTYIHNMCIYTHIWLSPSLCLRLSLSFSQSLSVSLCLFLCLYIWIYPYHEHTKLNVHKRAALRLHACAWLVFQASLFTSRLYIWVCLFCIRQGKKRTVFLKYTSLTFLYFTGAWGPATFGPWVRVPGPCPLWLSIWASRASDRQSIGNSKGMILSPKVKYRKVNDVYLEGNLSCFALTETK